CKKLDRAFRRASVFYLNYFAQRTGIRLPRLAAGGLTLSSSSLYDFSHHTALLSFQGAIGPAVSGLSGCCVV
ncbi:MAG: hypothetical protein IJJ33_14250, partial [Victivallales bacterium]|nr:hypothetical protein [Victivallales bacterium]